MVSDEYNSVPENENVNLMELIPFIRLVLILGALVIIMVLIYCCCCRKKKKHTDSSQPVITRRSLQQEQIEERRVRSEPVTDHLTLARQILEDNLLSTSRVDQGPNGTTEVSSVSNQLSSPPISNFAERTTPRGTSLPSLLQPRIPAPSQLRDDTERQPSQGIQMQHYERMNVDDHPQLARLLPWDTSRLPPTQTTDSDEHIVSSTTRLPLDPSAPPPAYHEFEIASNPVESPSAPLLDSPTVYQESERTFTNHSNNSLSASSNSLPTYDEVEGGAGLELVPQHAQEERLPPSYEDFIARPHAYRHIPDNVLQTEL